MVVFFQAFICVSTTLFKWVVIGFKALYLHLSVKYPETSAKVENTATKQAIKIVDFVAKVVSTLMVCGFKVYDGSIVSYEVFLHVLRVFNKTSANARKKIST